MTNLARIPSNVNEREVTCRAIIETPQGHRQKINYNPEFEVFEFGALLPEGMALPLAFGFVPGTLGEDGDPIDIMVFTDEPAVSGAMTTVRLVGVIEAEETRNGETFRNDRLIGVAENSQRYSYVISPENSPDAVEDQLVAFWVNYNALKGRVFRPLGVHDGGRALELVKAAVQARADRVR